MTPRPTTALSAALALLGAVGVTVAESPYPRLTNIAADRPVVFQPTPNYPEVSDAGDATQLTDGRLAGNPTLWYDSAAVGWVGVDPVGVTLDLGADRPIRGVAVHTAAGKAGVEWPARVQVLVSLDGQRFTPVGDLRRMDTQRLPVDGYADAWLATDRLQTHGRYIRLQSSPTDRGAGAYIFTDEVQVFRGDDAWLDQPLETVKAPDRWKADWRGAPWERGAGVPDAERPRRLRVIDGREVSDDRPLHSVEPEADRITFQVRGEAGQPRRMTWTQTLEEPISTQRCRYAVLTFQCTGVRRTYEPFAMVKLGGLNLGEGASNATLLDVNAAMDDGRPHTVVTRLPEGFTLSQIEVALPTESSAASLTIQRLELISQPPAVAGVAVQPGGDAPLPDGYRAVPLGDQLNDSLSAWYGRQLEAHGSVIDGASRLDAGEVIVSGAPFRIAEGEKNLAALPVSEPSEKQVEFLGSPVYERHLRPQSRDDALAIEADSVSAREVLLLLTLHAPPVQPRYGLPSEPLALEDIEVFSVDLEYADGSRTTAFPYSLADSGARIASRELGAYVVAADPDRKLTRIVLRSHHHGPNFGVAAVTLNTSPRAMVPQLAEVEPPTPTTRHADPEDRAVTITHDGDRLSITNRWYACEVDLGQGFVIDRLVNRYSPDTPIQLGESSGLRVRLGDTIYTGRSFRSRVLSVGDRGAVLQLDSTRPALPLSIRLTIEADDSPRLSFAAEAVNRGDQPMQPEVCVPALTGLSLGELEQTRLFFPQYRATETGADVTLRAPYGVEFPQQFMDIYNRVAGVGLIVRTDNPGQQMATFALSKTGEGVDGGVHFPADYHPLAAGSSHTYPTVSLIAHTGDWRTAVDLQRDWIRTWYQPVESQDEAFFLDAWSLACYRPSQRISWSDAKVPGFINADRTAFLTEEVMDLEQETLGHLPDIIHFFNWTHNDKTHVNEYGVFGTPKAYAQVGGLEFFREGIQDIQHNWGIPVSLYTLPDRVRASALPDPALAQHVVDSAWYSQPDNDASAGLRASDTVDGIYYPPRGDERWLDFTLSDIAKMQRDTGCRLVYVDVFAHWSHLHSSDVSPRDADMTVLTRLREMLPDDVVFWSEYPPTDVGSQYADGALHYYFLELNETFARPYDHSSRIENLYRPSPLNIGRYLLTRYKYIGLPGGIERSNRPSATDTLFVNGEAIQEDTWRLHPSRIRVKLNRAYEVQRRYNDCFTSDHPQPHVDTAVQGITANLFPGDDRNLWTLFNGRPATYAGPILKIPHRDGAVYRDAWNGKVLHPTIEDGVATIMLALDPQQPGCVVQDWSGQADRAAD